MTTLSPPPSSLPQELWKLVLENIRQDADRAELWCSLRRVNKGFKEIIEGIFKERHLKYICVTFNLGMASCFFFLFFLRMVWG